MKKLEKIGNHEYTMCNGRTKEISRMNDYFARFLLGQKGNESLLLNFINSVMKDSELEEFSSLTIQNPYNLKEHSIDSETIVDVKATTSSGETVIVEVQVRGSKTFFSRVLEYWAKNYRTEQIEKADGTITKRLSPVISINLLSFTLFPEIPNAHSSHMIHCCETKKVTSDKLVIHFLELPKAFRGVQENDLQTWLQFFGSQNFEQEKEVIAKKGMIFEKAVHNYNYFKADKDLVSEYEKRETFLYGQQLMMEENYDEGREEGREEGLKEGLEQGRAKGYQEKAIETAKKAISFGLSIADVSKITDLSESEIKSLIQD